MVPLEQVDDFQAALQRTLSTVNGGAFVAPILSDIVLDSLLALPALIYNENRLGEWRTRGSVAF
jgi:hypothetical protein